MALRSLIALAALAVALGLAAPALAGGGNYVIDGGSPFERAQVVKALNASTFDWGLVPGPVTIHIVNDSFASYSSPGQTWLAASVLDTGQFSWGMVQMEYGQQVQFSLLDAPMKAQLTSRLGAQQWCYDNPALPPGANACERFAATLAWAYWPSRKNCMQPAGAGDWSASMEPAAFRALLATMIGATDEIDNTQSVRALASAQHVHSGGPSQAVPNRRPRR